MKKSVFLISLIAMGFLLVGFGPRPYSDLATYKRIPTVKRVDNLMKAGKDLFLRRRYEDARSIFQMILDMDKKNLEAKFYISKIDNLYELEQNEQKKQALFKKWGHLTPIDKIYENWHWGPEVGHFEVRYSEPKPYVPAVRKFRPKATDAEVTEAAKLYANSKTAENAFELAMRYWSRREKSAAIKYYLEAVDMKPEILELDDEYMLSMISEEVEEKISLGNPTPEDYLTYGRLAMIQGNRDEGISSLIKAAVMSKKLKGAAEKALDNYISKGFVDIVGIPAEIYSFRQAYVFDKDKDSIYMRIILCPTNKRQLIPIDTTFAASATAKVSIESKDAVFVYNKPGIGESSRLWIALPEKEGEFPEYEVRLILSLNRESLGVDLSNYSLPSEQPDNWSFIISSEFNNTNSELLGNYEKNENGVRVSAFHLGTTDGRGPYVSFENYKESLPSDANVWKIIEDKEGEMSLLF